MKPCLTCQTPSEGSYCDEHTPKPWQHREGSARRRGYSTAWDKLSRRARRLQPFCSDCGATDDLQLDHTERTWQRHEQGKVIRLKDTGGVVCGPCNRARGAARGRLESQGTGALEGISGPRAKAQSRLHSGDYSDAAEDYAESAEPESPFPEATEAKAGPSFAVINAEHDGNNKGSCCNGEFHQARLS